MSFVDCRDSLLKSNLCVLPSETVYGLACSALSVEAIEKVFLLKSRPASNPLIVHVLNHRQASEISYTNKFSQKLADALWPGPLTLILPKKKCIPYKVTAGLNSVAIRAPSHRDFRKMLRSINMPIAAPSANKSNKISPTCYQDVISEFGKDCPPLIDGGPCQIGIESTVLDLTLKVPEILRLGSCTKREIESAIGIEVRIPDTKAKLLNSGLKTKKSPGLMHKHYAPDTPLFIYPTLEKLLSSRFSASSDLILLPSQKCRLNGDVSKINIHYLSKEGEPHEITKNLYLSLRHLDNLNKDRIYTSLFPSDDGVFSAINDRLIRASTKCL